HGPADVNYWLRAAARSHRARLIPRNVMPSDHDKFSADPATTHAMQCAAHWLAVLSDENCTEAERRQFLVWLRASGQHVDEFLRLSRLNAQVSRRELWPQESVADLIAAAKAGGE